MVAETTRSLDEGGPFLLYRPAICTKDRPAVGWGNAELSPRRWSVVVTGSADAGAVLPARRGRSDWEAVVGELELGRVWGGRPRLAGERGWEGKVTRRRSVPVQGQGRERERPGAARWQRASPRHSLRTRILVRAAVRRSGSLPGRCAPCALTRVPNTPKRYSAKMRFALSSTGPSTPKGCRHKRWDPPKAPRRPTGTRHSSLAT